MQLAYNFGRTLVLVDELLHLQLFQHFDLVKCTLDVLFVDESVPGSETINQANNMHSFTARHGNKSRQ